jgi:DNA-binding transcriptional MerR regulator
MAYMLETVARITGATIKQLIHWDLSGLVQPSVVPAHGKGSRRVYSFLDILAIKTAVTLRREGISLQKIRRCLKYLREHQPEVQQPLASLNLVTDGVSVFRLSHDPKSAWQDRKVVDTLAGGQLVWMVPIGRIACEAQREAARLVPESTVEIPPSVAGIGLRKRTQRKDGSLRKGVRAG